MGSELGKKIFLTPPHMGGEELRYIRNAFETNYIAPLGPMVDTFERDFSKKVCISNTLAVSTGTAAIHLALLSLGVGPGDEVFVSALTFIGGVTPILFQGATPVFIDSDLSTWNMDPALVESELAKCEKKGKIPKAVIPTDLYGQCADYERILPMCRKYGVPVIADAAEAVGAKHKVSKGENKWLHAGVGAKAAVFSFNGNKIITTSGGGMLASEDESLIRRARFLSQQARDPAPHYEHSEIGYNYRMSNIVAAIGLGQLKVLDDRVRKKREIFAYYRNGFEGTPGVEFMPEAPNALPNRWLTVILIKPEEFGTDRETVRLALEAQNIEARPVWKPMHLQPVFQLADKWPRPKKQKPTKRTYKARIVGGEVSEDLFERGLCLPSGTAMVEKDLDRVIEIILNCRKP